MGYVVVVVNVTLSARAELVLKLKFCATCTGAYFNVLSACDRCTSHHPPPQLVVVTRIVSLHGFGARVVGMADGACVTVGEIVLGDIVTGFLQIEPSNETLAVVLNGSDAREYPKNPL